MVITHAALCCSSGLIKRITIIKTLYVGYCQFLQSNTGTSFKIVKQERELGMSIQKMGENQYVVWDNDCWTPRFIGTYDECFAFKKKLEEVEGS